MMKIIVFLTLVAVIAGCTSTDKVAMEGVNSTVAAVFPTTSNAPATDEPSVVTQQPMPYSATSPKATAIPASATSTVDATPTHQEADVATATPPVATEATQAPPNSAYEYVLLAEQSLDRYAKFVAWEPDGRGLVYALQKERGDGTVRRVGPGNWEWWRYDPVSGQSTPLPPPESAVSMEVRRMLGICAPQPLPGDECGREPIMWESPYGDWVIYNPSPGGETVWIAHKDGSNARILEGQGVGSAINAHWSSDGRWVVVSTYAHLAPGMELHFLVDLHSGAIQQVASLTGHTTLYVNYLRPQFSPDGRYLVYAATEDPDYKLLSGYGLYLLDMNTLKSERLTNLYGPFQWDADSQGLYVFDNALDFEFAERILAPRKAALYHIDLSSRPIQETLLFDNIDFYPNEIGSARHWSYSPELQAIAYIGLRPENELGILFLAP